MNEDATLAFAHAMGISDAEIFENDAGGLWCRGTCPLSWLHAKGKDRNPSFGIKINNEGESFWYCFAHGGGTLPGLIHTMTWHRNFYHKEACDILSRFENVEDVDIDPIYNDVYKSEKKVWPPTQSIAPEAFDGMFPSVKRDSFEWDFLRDERRIPAQIIKYFDLRYWPDESIVILPVRNPLGELMAAVTRNIYNKQFRFLTVEWTGHPEFNFPSLLASGNFFGEQHAVYNQPMMIVESALEACTVAGLGWTNVIACCGSINKHQLERVSMYDPLYLGFDADPPGRKSALKVIKRHISTNRIRRINWLDEGITDPGELTSELQLKLIIDKADWVNV